MDLSDFLEERSDLFAGARVLDFGAGDQPYERIVKEAGGDYWPWDRMSLPGSVCQSDIGPEDWRRERWDVILCTDVVQYVSPLDLIKFVQRFATTLAQSRGHLIFSYPSSAQQVGDLDLLRFTRAGAEWLVDYANMTIVEHVRLGTVDYPDPGGVIVAR